MSALSRIGTSPAPFYWYTPQMFGAPASPVEGDGDMSAYIHAAIDAVRTARGGGIYLPAGTYRCDSSLDFTGYDYGIRVMGAAWDTSIILSHAAGKGALDICGTRNIIFENLCVEGDTTDVPACGFLGARTVALDKCDHHVFRNVSMHGKFIYAGWYLIDAEVITVDNGFTSTPFEAPYVYYTSGLNDDAITSDYQTISTATDGSTHHRILNSSFGCTVGTNCTPIRTGAFANNWNVLGTYLQSRGTGVGIEMAVGCNSMLLQSIVQEGNSDTFLLLPADTVSNMTMMNIQAPTRLIYGGAGSVLNGATIANCREDDTTDDAITVETVGLQSLIYNWANLTAATMVLGTLQYSTVWCYDFTKLTIGTFDRSFIKNYNTQPVKEYATSATPKIGERTVLASGVGTVISLLENAPEGTMFTIKRRDAANNIVVSRTGADTIDGAVSWSLNTNNAFITCVSDGTRWFIISTGGTVV